MRAAGKVLQRSHVNGDPEDQRKPLMRVFENALKDKNAVYAIQACNSVKVLAAVGAKLPPGFERQLRWWGQIDDLSGLDTENMKEKHAGNVKNKIQTSCTAAADEINSANERAKQLSEAEQWKSLQHHERCSTKTYNGDILGREVEAGNVVEAAARHSCLNSWQSGGRCVWIQPGLCVPNCHHPKSSIHPLVCTDVSNGEPPICKWADHSENRSSEGQQCVFDETRVEEVRSTACQNHTSGRYTSSLPLTLQYLFCESIKTHAEALRIEKERHEKEKAYTEAEKAEAESARTETERLEKEEVEKSDQ